LFGKYSRGKRVGFVENGTQIVRVIGEIDLG
jgi:hypothetical protein